jgi:hypothetical protein
MKARIREQIRRVVDGPRRPAGEHAVDIHEEYFDANEVARRLKLSRDTVKELMRTETIGVIRIGNVHRTMRKRPYVTERYSASAVERLIRRLERGEDPRYSS